MTYQQVSDKQLTQSCAEGDAAAWDELVRRFQDAVYGVARYRCKLQEEDVADVFQETFETVFTRLSELRDQEKVRSWIVRIAWRKSIDHIRDERAQKKEEFDETTLMQESMEASDQLSQMEHSQLVAGAIDALPSQIDRSLVMCRYYEEMSYTDIAEGLNIPPGSVSSILARGLKFMAAWLAERGVAPMDDGPL